MTSEANHAILIYLDPDGVKCFLRLVAESRRTRRFSSDATSREAQPRMLAWLGGSDRLVLYLPLSMLLKALHDDPAEFGTEKIMLGDCTSHKYYLCCTNRNKFDSLLLKELYSTTLPVDNMTKMNSPADITTDPLTELASAPVIRSGISGGGEPESAMTIEANHAILTYLDPDGVKCFLRLVAEFRRTRRFSSDATSREAQPRMLAWLGGSDHLVLYLPLSMLLKALHDDPAEFGMEKIMLGDCTSHKYYLCCTNRNKFDSLLLKELYSTTPPVDNMTKMNSPADITTDPLTELASAPVIRSGISGGGEPESAMTSEANHAILIYLDPDGVKCFLRLVAESRRTRRFSSDATSREAQPRMLAWLGGSDRLVLYLPLSMLLKALHDDPAEFGMEKIMLGDCTSHKYYLCCTNRNKFDSLLLKELYSTTPPVDNMTKMNSPADITTDPLTELASAPVIRFGMANEVELIHGSMATFFVEVEGKSISVRQNLSTTTTKMLLDHVCEKKGMINHDGYAVYLGKSLDENKLLSECEICNNCTVQIRGRGRAGRKREIECITFDESMKDVDLFHLVSPLPKTLTNNVTKMNSATFLSENSQWHARQVLISLGRMHFRKKSLNGKFNANHILFYDGRVIFDESCAEVDFCAEACRNDYIVIAGIFERWFKTPGEQYPLFVKDLIEYLSECPLGDESNSAAAIAFLVNHPALVNFMERIKQCSQLDDMVDRLTEDEKLDFCLAVGNSFDWIHIAKDVQAMKETLVYDRWSKDPAQTDDADEENIAYIDDQRSCLKFSRNHFKHARSDLLMERIEASFSLNYEEFLPKILQDIVKKFKGPLTFDIVKMLGNNVVDMKRKRDVLDAESPAKVIAPPVKRPRISFALASQAKKPNLSFGFKN